MIYEQPGGLSIAWQVRQAYSHWARLLPWDFFITLTLDTGGLQSEAYLLRRLSRFIATIQSRCNGALPRLLLGVERQQRGTAHAHGLMFLHGRTRVPAELETLWFGIAGGWAVIRRFVPHAGAIDYVTKVAGASGELHLLGPWPSYEKIAGNHALGLCP